MFARTNGNPLFYLPMLRHFPACSSRSTYLSLQTKEMSKMGEGKHRLSRKKMKLRAIRQEQAEYMEEARREREAGGDDSRKRVDEDTVKASARAKKLIMDEKRDKKAYEKSISEQYGGNGKRKAPKRAAGDAGMFDDEAARHQRKRKGGDEGGGGEAQGVYGFTEFNPKAHLKKGGKKGPNKFKSKSKHKRR